MKNTNFPQIAGILLAAGNSSRMGSPKALLPINNSTFIDTILKHLNAAGCQPIISVLGAHGEMICRSTAVDTYQCVSNPYPQEGMLSSLKIAIQQLPEEVEGFILALVDHPMVRESTYHEMVKLARRKPDKIIIPRFFGKNGHPVYFGKSYFKQLLDTPNSAGARVVVYQSREMVRFLDVDDAGILQNIDTPEAFGRIAQS